MVRVIELLTVFFLSLNLFSGMLITSGVAADIGLGGQVQVGGGDAKSDLENSASEISSGAPTGSTLFGQINVLGDTLGAIRTMAFGGPTMLANAGVPGFITTPLGVLVGVVYAFGIIKFLRGI